MGGNLSISLPSLHSGESSGGAFSFNSSGDGMGSGTGSGHTGGPLEEVLEREKEFLEKFFLPAEGEMELDPDTQRTRNLSIRWKPGKKDMKEKWF